MSENKKPFAHHNVKVRKIIPHASAPTDGYYPDQVAAAYGYPKGVSAAGRTIGLIELGGSNYASDLSTFCSTRSLPVPAVTQVLVGSATIQPDPGNADVEAMLDIENVVAAFPGAAIKVYFADNTEAGFIAAVQQALAQCDAVSCSWGAPEDQWSTAGLQSMNTAIAASTTPFCAASGDSGSTDGEKGKHVDFPASSPYAIACGGTTLPAGSNGLPNISAETSWPDSGGGISMVFSKPSYQSAVTQSTSMRCTPDVAMCADPNTPYNIYVNGQWMQVGGTSAVAPLMAALFGLLKAQAGKLPADVHPLLYAAGACRDITGGSNGSYSAGPGYDCVTGNGVPVYSALLTVIQGGTPTPIPTPTPVPTPTPTPISTPVPTPTPTPPSLPVPISTIEVLLQQSIADIEADINAEVSAITGKLVLLDLADYLVGPLYANVAKRAVRKRVTEKVTQALQTVRAKKAAA